MAVRSIARTRRLSTPLVLPTLRAGYPQLLVTAETIHSHATVIRADVSMGALVARLIDDVTKECLAAVVYTSISGRRVVRGREAIAFMCGKHEPMVRDNGKFTTRRRLKHGIVHSLVDLQAAINRFIRNHNAANPKPLFWSAGPDDIIAARKRGFETLDRIS